MKTPVLRLALICLAILCGGLANSALAQTSKTFTVTSSAAGTPNTTGTLTWAVYQANYQGAEINYINFNIPGAGETEITLSEQLFIARPTVIDGTTEPGYAGQPRIRINCNQFASGFLIVPAGSGLPGGGGSTIRGLRMINYTANAITIFRGADGNTIADNQIGFAPQGGGTYFRNVTVAAQCGGIGIQSSNNVIRGNTVSGTYNAIVVGDDISAPSGATYKGNSFEGNFVGTDPTGTSKIGNDSDGIFLGAGCQQNLIGPNNVLSGMASSGVEILHPTATDNVIFSNMIGLNAAGTAPIPNGELGVLIANGASKNFVGGVYGGPYPGNVISANTLAGVAIGTFEFQGANGTNDNHVEGNFIGTNASGTQALGTQGSGVVVQFKAKNNVVRKNVIVGQSNHGVVLSDASSNALYGNWIGMTITGTLIPNGNFGVFLNNTANNIVQLSAAAAAPGKERNFFGTNNSGRTGQTGTSSGDVIDPSSPPTPTPPPTVSLGTSHPQNISTRLRVETGDDVAIAGFIISGTSPKKVMLRGRGPSVGLPGVLPDPTLELVIPGGVSISNDDWQSTQGQEISATGLAPGSPLDSAIIATLNPGAYTAILAGKGSAMGIGIVEVFDIDPGSPSTLANISTRGVVRTGDNIMIAGFILGGGNGSCRIVLRARGESLAAAGIANPLPNPRVDLVDSNGNVVRSNDSWLDDAVEAAQLVALRLAPSGFSESSILTALPPGGYTALVSDVTGLAGTGLVEAYYVP